MVFQITVTMYIIHETGLVIFAYKTEHIVLYLLVSRDIDGIIVVSVAVHVVRHDVRVIVSAAPCFVNHAVVVAAFVVDGGRSDDTIRRDILGIVQSDIVWSFNSRNIGEGRFGS